MQYWIARNNQKVGPYSLEDVHRMMADNKLVRSDLAWTEGMPNWGPVFDVIPAPREPEPVVHPASAFDALAPTRIIQAMRPPPGYDAPQSQAAAPQPAPVPQPASFQPNPAPQAAAPQASAVQPSPIQPSPVQPSSAQPSTYQPNPYPSQQLGQQPGQQPVQPPPQQQAQQPAPYAPAQPSQFAPSPAGQFAPQNQPFQPAAYAPPPPAAQATFQPPPPAAQAPPYQQYPGQAMQGQPMPGQPMPGQGAPYQAGGPLVPPGMHWALVWVLGAVTFGIFIVVWMFKQANFVQRIDPANPSRKLFTLTLILAVAYGVIVGAAIAIQSPGAIAIAGGVGLLIELGAVVCSYIGYFKMRTSMLNYYNTVEPIGLRLSPVMTFFFNVLYFQYHFHRIAQWKQTGMLTPQK